jgi:ABC-type Mn2+/Zn2+ transport system permease subunit
MTVKAAGLLFVFGSMVIPPMIALSIMRSIGRIILASCIVTVALVAAGIVISIYADLPVSATIGLMYALVLAGVEVLRVLLTR